MGYMHIDNLYRKVEFIELFKEVFVSEKVHGTSAHISLSQNGVSYSSGGVAHSDFIKLFDTNNLLQTYHNLKTDNTFVIFGEAYGGKCQKMSATYGKELRFIAFEVTFGLENRYWMNQDKAHEFVNQFDLEFVPYYKCANTLDNLNYHKKSSIGSC